MIAVSRVQGSVELSWPNVLKVLIHKAFGTLKSRISLPHLLFSTKFPNPSPC